MNVNPWKQKSMGLPSGQACKNTGICGEEVKHFPFPQDLEGTEGAT